MQYVEPSLRHIRNAAKYYSDQAYREKYVHEKYSPEQIAQAIRRTKGGIAAAARLLRCAKDTVLRYLTAYPELRKIADEEIELVLDLCEESLFHDAVNGDPDARRFVLLTRGRDRGYVIRREGAGATGQPVNPGDTNNTVILIDGNKEEYLAGLRKMRDAARAAQGLPIDATASSVSGHNYGNNGSAPAIQCVADRGVAGEGIDRLPATGRPEGGK